MFIVQMNDLKVVVGEVRQRGVLSKRKGCWDSGHRRQEDTDLHRMVMEIRHYNFILVVHSHKMGP